MKRVFSKGESTNWSYKLFTVTQVIHDSFPSSRLNYLPERYNENLLKLPKLSLDENDESYERTKHNLKKTVTINGIIWRPNIWNTG